MSGYVFTIQARLDIKEINKFIARENPQAATRFIDAVEEKCKVLADFPNMGRSFDYLAPSLRGFSVGNYIIFYRSIEDGIEVERVLSGYRDFDALFLDDDA
ncbi:type II toxin-antitoxin system RelE/ParE family toxin [Scytonema hofmannii FACHB-248]|uniref:Type II toxin-antitoxin system RelE/ParE family toxin n=1 Tax=Scytonema hofmannii FACHB-248 TaxID=1842502 RepID=A0ABR8GR95_9CYAN|nr:MULTISPECIES: type II toxin-antitoxin system RelE/ParE family toxin [Nostocales]MBD2605714.1 type II toxin-antitoxin system RelE/ParE family toxin [Scytonema hofmannii FACHB-248]